ncbi:unnamed protein product [Oreochromis niloticus]|nr:unnamed protein product [Mustela putorius furo]
MVSREVVQAICERHSVNSVGLDPESFTCPGLALVESLALHATAVPDSFEEELLGGSPLAPPVTEDELRQKQRLDPALNAVVTQLETGQTPPPSLRAELPELPLLLRELSRLELQNGVLYRKRQTGPDISFQLVLPEELRPMVFQHLHNNMGHLGNDRTIDLVRARFYWPKMQVSVEKMISTCERCVRRKCKPERAAPLMNIQTSRPLELVCIDYLSIEPDQSNTKDVLVMTDHFTKFAVAVPTPNQRARTVAKALWENFIVHYGVPERLLSDQGPDFESKTISELCEIIGMKKIRTTPYHPRANPVERFNRTLLQMLGTLSDNEKLHWKEYVKPLVHAYNCTKNDVTGYSPYVLMFGRQPRLPIDLVFGLPVNAQKKSHSQYVSDLKHRLEESFKIATSNAQKNAERNKTRFDKQVVDSTLNVGDRVLFHIYHGVNRKQFPKPHAQRNTRQTVVQEDDDLDSEYLPIPTWIPMSIFNSAKSPKVSPALVVPRTESVQRQFLAYDETECDNPTRRDKQTEEIKETETENLPEHANLPEPSLLGTNIQVEDPVEKTQQPSEQILPSVNETMSERLNDQEAVITEQPSAPASQNSSQENHDILRRSQRSHQRPERLQYSKLVKNP